MLKQYLVRLASITCLFLFGLLMIGPVAPVLAMPHTYFDSGVFLKSDPIIMTTGIEQNLKEGMSQAEDTSDLDDSGTRSQQAPSDAFTIQINKNCTGFFGPPEAQEVMSGYWRKLGPQKVKCINQNQRLPIHPLPYPVSECRVVPDPPNGQTYNGIITSKRTCEAN